MDRFQHHFRTFCDTEQGSGSPFGLAMDLFPTYAGSRHRGLFKEDQGAMLESPMPQLPCIFELLGVEDSEIRHSRMVAWLLDPEREHGLGEGFLRSWLMRVISEEINSIITPVLYSDLENWSLRSVSVHREWRNIDILVILTFSDSKQWVLCIENKVDSIQSENQLANYRERVALAFPAAEKKLFIFLTKRAEKPHDEAFMSASYGHVHAALESCVQESSKIAPTYQGFLLRNYMELLDRRFLKPPASGGYMAASEPLAQLIHENEEELGVESGPTSSRVVRFVPIEWQQPGNTHGNEWTGRKESILFELEMHGRVPRLKVVAAKTPNPWIDPLWVRASLPPFQRQEPRSVNYPVLHLCEGPTFTLEEDDPAIVARQIFEWCKATYETPETREVIDIVARQLPSLDEMCTGVLRLNR